MTQAANIDTERLTGLLQLMQRIRAFEQAAIAAQKEGLVLGAIHPSIGQEAVAAGICTNLEQADLMLSTHRGHGHTLAKGADPLAMMRELFGRAGGTCGGKGGSMHIADFGVGMLGANGVVGANIPIATGAAHGLKLQGSRQIVTCIFGDGAVNRGPFLEGLNWARVFDLPVLFVCEDNGFSATTRTATMTGGAGAGARAQSIGIPAIEVDGNDLMAVDTAARAAINDIRAGMGPTLLHAKTYRITGHTAVDPATYRPAEEVEAQQANCPIARLQSALTLAGVEAARLAALHTEALHEMTDIAAQAQATDWPDPALAYADVQDVGNPAERAF
ncbi:thiamine pyrophosphate-dependent dehydrogenase E1 component subunit alpha [Aquicoccus sp. G2-2]|uniref:thiamine pyrophosphate-dependent dehydrogenase E1 component subunit alpha n=1 Tax=Aquicoccus sp. G2-2 TaxID=3092120 RepID=UPI002AE046DF|nr:thiamine pyrophosphate-dependent dehydrogenase E1 component subunit alpha [Aquicoccus sp. G2-2]MEA1114807.1 thiamine pyrophosphate-dependent dehydrogenase E1 component subunit alpha [Aquicoccus sp. G2-2]